ncbi:MAG: DUF6702 family protein [Pseudomonadota bacterium]
MRPRALATGALLAASTLAWAHLYHVGLTEISHNDRSGSVEVVHTLMTHDVEALLSDLYQRPLDLAQPDDEAALRKYVEKQFYVLGRDGARLPLRWVGIDAGADQVVIYRELERTPLSAVARVHDAILSDFIADQKNTVNVKQTGAVHTLSFDAGKTETSVP